MDLRTREEIVAQVKQYARCVAIANLCLIRIWSELLSPGPRSSFETNPSPERYWSAILLTLVIGALLYLASRAGRLIWHSAAFLAGCFVAKGTFYTLTNAGLISRLALYSWLVKPTGQLALAAGVVILLGSAIYFVRHGGPPIRTVATALFPFALLTIGDGVRHALSAPPVRSLVVSTRTDRQPAIAPAQPHPRVVWIILDELDELVAFHRRPQDVALPALDRFRQEASFVALQARSPANATSHSIPALLAGSPIHRLPAHPAAFEPAQRAGWRVGLTGWALPYCHEIEGLAQCECAPMVWQSNSYGENFGRIFHSQARSLFETNIFSPFGQSRTSQEHVRILRRLQETAGRMASDPNLDFVYIHLPAPHGPFVFNRKTGRPDAWSWPKVEGYYDNLPLADQVFSSLRTSMEKSGLWDRTLVLVTADHGYRARQQLGLPADDLHVPFMLKTVPGVAPIGLRPEAPLATIETGRILNRVVGLSSF